MYDDIMTRAGRLVGGVAPGRRSADPAARQGAAHEAAGALRAGPQPAPRPRRLRPGPHPGVGAPGARPGRHRRLGVLYVARAVAVADLHLLRRRDRAAPRALRRAGGGARRQLPGLGQRRVPARRRLHRRRPRRVRSAADMAPGRTSLVVAALLPLLLHPTTAPAQTVGPVTLVVPFALEKFDPRVAWLGEGTAIGLTTALAERGLDVVGRDERLAVFERLQLPPGATLDPGHDHQGGRAGRRRPRHRRAGRCERHRGDDRRAGAARRHGPARSAAASRDAGRRIAADLPRHRRGSRAAGARPGGGTGAGAVGAGLRAVRQGIDRRQRGAAGTLSRPRRSSRRRRTSRPAWRCGPCSRRAAPTNRRWRRCGRSPPPMPTPWTPACALRHRWCSCAVTTTRSPR